MIFTNKIERKHALVFGLWYFVSYVITLSIVVVFSFLYNAYLTFHVLERKKRNFVIYCFVLFVFNLADASLVRLSTEILGFHYIISIVTVTTFLSFLKYLVYDKIVFQ